jgi:hypothetical protein
VLIQLTKLILVLIIANTIGGRGEPVVLELFGIVPYHIEKKYCDMFRDKRVLSYFTFYGKV